MCHMATDSEEAFRTLGGTPKLQCKQQTKLLRPHGHRILLLKSIVRTEEYLVKYEEDLKVGFPAGVTQYLTSLCWPY